MTTKADDRKVVEIDRIAHAADGVDEPAGEHPITEHPAKSACHHQQTEPGDE